MVVEATVEGDVTRYTGIYLCRKIDELVGPVRSGRYYSIDLWQDMHVLPFMFGAGGEGVRRYHAAHLPFINGITGQWPYYVRSHDRPAPHNLYANLQLVRNDFGHNQALDRLAGRTGDLRAPFHFDPDVKLPSGRPVDHVQFFTNSFWNFGWEWDRQLGAWQAERVGHDHVDAGTHRVLAATSVMVQYVARGRRLRPHDPGGYPRRYHHLVGQGDATLYVGGARGRGPLVASHREQPDALDATSDGGEPVVLPPGGRVARDPAALHDRQGALSPPRSTSWAGRWDASARGRHPWRAGSGGPGPCCGGPRRSGGAPRWGRPLPRRWLRGRCRRP